MNTSIKYKKKTYGYDVYKNEKKSAKIVKGGGWNILLGDDEWGFESVELGYTLDHAKHILENRFLNR